MSTRSGSAHSPILTILSLWSPHAPALLGGVLLSLAAFAVGLSLLALSGLRLAGTGAGLVLASGLLLRLLGAGRVLLRYGERLLTHDAMFRALADLRVWFFRRVARSAAGGIGFRRSGDLLSRLVGDVEALDGLYLRNIVPLAASRAGPGPRRGGSVRRLRLPASRPGRASGRQAGRIAVGAGVRPARLGARPGGRPARDPRVRRRGPDAGAGDGPRERAPVTAA